MPNTFALFVRALVFACFLSLSAVAIAETNTSSPCVVSSAPLNFDAQDTRVANVESSATVQVEWGSAPEPGNHTGTIAVTAMY